MEPGRRYESRSSNDEYRRIRHPNEGHPFVTSERGTERLDSATGHSFRSFTASNSSSSASGSDGTSTIMMRRCMITLYKNTVGRDPDEMAMEEINAVIHTEPDKRNLGNETRWMEKLKLHLIKQEKGNEAKRFMELYQKLKGMSVVKNRQSIVGLMYNLFDQEKTRAIMAARSASQKSSLSVGMSTNVKAENILSRCEDSRMEQNYFSQVVASDRQKVKTRHGGSTAAEGLKGRPITAPCQDARMKCMNYFDAQDVDHTPIPRLYCSSDNLLNQDMNSDTKVPSLSMPVHETKTPLDLLSGLLDERNQFRGGGELSTLNSISKISRHHPDESSLNFATTQNSVINMAGQVFSSTPIDQAGGGASRKRQFVNLRRSQDNQSNLKSTQNFKIGGGGTAQTFTNTKTVERDLIRDIVFILQGIDGNYIKTSAKGTFEISTKQFVHPALRLQTFKLCEMGYCYTKIRNYCEKSTTGQMAQGFKHAIEKELQEYYRLLAVIQGKIQQTAVDTPMSEDLPLNKIGDMSLLKLGIWLFECRPRLQILSGMVESCDGRKGGDLCSVIHKYSQHGDPLVSNLTVSLLSTICKPLYIMLSQWILYGELEDPYSEFFIWGDPGCKKEQLWHQKYRIRSEMLPSFISMKQAEKILAIGKNINFLKEICNNADGFAGRYEVKALLETGEVECLFLEENSPIQYAIEMSYKTTSEKVLKVLIDDSNLLDHLKAIKKYLLLGQGDFIQYFLELIQDELSKPASKLYNHNISAILESAVRATNAQFENEDILSRLDTRILPTSDKDLGWDVFCLDYKAHGPIGTVLTEEVMNGYNKLFNSLWRTKRIEIILSTLWKNQTVLFKYLRLIPEIAPVLHRSQLLISEMIHFVHQTQYYIMFEATECAWERLMEDVNKSSDLDEVIQAHKKFLDTIFKRSLLDIESRELLNQLRGIFDSVHELRTFLQEFNGRVEGEVNHRKNLEPNSGEVRDAQRQFFSSYVMQAKGKIETLYTTTQDLVRTFLLVLNRQQDLTLQCLSFRLDFNEYYHQKDSRLSQPLTFQHRRRSSNAFTPINMSGSFTGVVNSPLLTSMSIPEGLED